MKTVTDLEAFFVPSLLGFVPAVHGRSDMAKQCRVHLVFIRDITLPTWLVHYTLYYTDRVQVQILVEGFNATEPCADEQCGEMGSEVVLTSAASPKQFDFRGTPNFYGLCWF